MRTPRRLSNITPEMILAAYTRGCFPMATGLYGEIDWFIADPRTIIPLDEGFRVRRSLRQALRKMNYEVRFNTCFAEVIRACSRQTELSEYEIWLSDEMIELYIELHRRGVAHSVEIRADGELIGGLYGVAIKSAFFGESMFMRRPYASQIALVELVKRLRERQFRLLDAQMRTPHIAHFGAVDLSHIEYLHRLADALDHDCQFT
ncbi:MAG: leucyl/phenylalanyl-tRNA--protein transferase [Acidobacteriota bacterium]